MSIRKNRIPLQGISNLRATEADWKTKTKNVWNPIEQFKVKNNQYPERDTEKQLKVCIPIQNNKNQEQAKNFPENNSIKAIRKSYKSRSNIWRIAKAWKFTQNGFITTEQFEQKMKNILGIDMSHSQASEIFRRFANTEGKMDIKSFLKIIYSENQNYAYNPRLFQLQDSNETRKEKIDNLIDKLDIYHHAFHHDRHRSFESVTIDPNSRTNKNKETNNLRFQNKQFNKDQFYRLTQQSFKKLRESSKQKYMHPSQMAGQNQRKTRFGATMFDFSRGGIFSGSHTVDKSQNRFHIFTDSKNFANDQRAQKKLKLQTKIEKIRQAQMTQKQNIQKMEEKWAEKQKGSLLRKRMDRQAYQYASYVKNKWL